MSYLRRQKVNKKRSRRKFNKHSRRTKAVNVHKTTMRGGFRL
jgi:hypothetical protein